MDTIIVRDTKKIGLKALCYLHVIVMLTIQIFCVYAYSTGLTTVFDKSITIPNAVEMLFEVFYPNGYWYTAIFSTCIGAMFLVFLVLMVKNVITSFAYIKKVTAFAAEFKPDTKGAILVLGSKTGENCVFAISFVMSCNFVFQTTLLPNVTKLVVCWLAAILLTRLIISFFERFTAGSLITKLIYDLIFAFSLVTFVLFTKSPALEMSIYSIRGITVGFAICLVGLIYPIIYLTIAIIGMKMMYDATFVSVNSTDEFSRSARNLLIGSILLGVASIVTYILYGYTSKLDFDSIVAMFEPYFPIIFMAGAVFVSTYFPLDIRKKSMEGVNTDKCVVDDQGVLRIYNHVTEIHSFAFGYRTDIKRIYIPESVTVIHEKAFFGCSSVKEIHCDHYAVGDGWADNWNEGCGANIYWKAPVVVNAVSTTNAAASNSAMPYAVPVAFVAYPTQMNYVMPTMVATSENHTASADPASPAPDAAPAEQSAQTATAQSVAEASENISAEMN